MEVRIRVHKQVNALRIYDTIRKKVKDIYVDCLLMLKHIGRMTKTLNHTMHAETDHLKNK
jgi:hypothetical protein